MDVAEVRQLPAGRLLALDDQGIGLRATWHPERGFVNLSLWRHGVCVETFHLSIEDAGRLTGFLVDGVAEVTAVALAPAPPAPERPRRGAWPVLDAFVHRIRAGRGR